MILNKCLQSFLLVSAASAFSLNPTTKSTRSTAISTNLFQQNDNNSNNDNDDNITIEMSRRNLFHKSAVSAAAMIFGGSVSGLILNEQPVSAQVFFDPAQYGDQELRIGAVDSVKESVRRAILQDPELAPSFYQLALLDGLSYNAETQAYGPDGRILANILQSKETDAYTKNLQSAALAIIDIESRLRKKVQISLADAIAIGGAESIESIGGPVLTVQLGRPDPPRDGRLSPVPLNLLSGNLSNNDVMKSFQSAGLTDREATALIAGLLTLDRVKKTRTSEDWRESARPKFREPGKMGRMSEFRAITEDDIQQALLDEELGTVQDDGWYIADSFGTKDSRFGQRIGTDEINEKNFNKFLKELTIANTPNSKTKSSNNSANSATIKEDYGWTAQLLLDSNFPTTASWLSKYAGANLNFVKDLNIAYNSVTQLGAVYTGGKYESLLKNKPRKTLNDDDIKGLF